MALGTSAQINTEQVMRIGQNAMYFEDYIVAIQYFNQAIQSKPYLPKPYYMRGWAKFYLDDYAGAEADATTALNINPYISDAYRLRGASRHNLGKYAEAIADYEAALKEYADDEGLLYNMGKAYAGMDSLVQADSVFTYLVDKHPSLDYGYFGAAGVKMLMGDTIAAVKYIDKGVEINPSDPSPYFMRYEIALRHDKDNNKALEALDKVVQLQPKNTDLYIARANLRYNVDDYFGAMADYTYALQLDPGNDVALFNRALLRTEIMDFDNALDDYTEILKTDPDNDLAIYNRAFIYAEKGMKKNAVDDISRFIKLYPDLSSAYFIRSQWLLDLGEKQKAKADYDKGRSLANVSRPIKHQVKVKSNLEKKYDQQMAENQKEKQVEELTPEEFERRLTKIIEVENDSPLNTKYEDSAIRGRIQNHNFNIDIEPMMQLSYFDTPSELQRKTYYIKEIDDLNTSRLLHNNITVAVQTPNLSEAQVKKLFESIDYYTSYLASHTPRTVDYIARGLDFLTLRNYEEALNDLNSAIALTPDYATAYMLRAQTRLLAPPSKDISRAVTLKAALDDLNKAVELSPRNAVAWYNKGNALFEANDYTSAILAYTKAIEYQPDMGEAYFNRGYANLKLGNADAGKADLSKAGELGIVPAYNLIKRITR